MLELGGLGLQKSRFGTDFWGHLGVHPSSSWIPFSQILDTQVTSWGNFFLQPLPERLEDHVGDQKVAKIMVSAGPGCVSDIANNVRIFDFLLFFNNLEPGTAQNIDFLQVLGWRGQPPLGPGSLNLTPWVPISAVGPISLVFR